MKFQVAVLSCFLLFSLACSGQFSPSVHNYKLAEYKAGNQNWDVSRAEDGKVYVANNSGLLEYDALIWKFYQLPNKTTVRSVLAVDDVIYTGSYEEFGYWKKDNTGLLKYHSLSKEISQLISPNEEIWEIIKFKGKIIFRSFLNIYVYDHTNLIQIIPDAIVISLSVVKDNLYVSTLDKGIFVLKDSKLELFFFDDLLVDTKIISISEYLGKLLIMTSLEGGFFLDNGQLVSTDFEINTQIKLHQLNAFSVLESGDMVFGTIKDGVFLTDKNGTLKIHISKENGLINNTVLGQSLDDNHNLWLGLDNGIAQIELNNSYYFYNDLSGKLGAVYDIIMYKDVLYIGTNTGLFTLDENNSLKFIEGSQGQVWDLKVIEGQLFCGHNEGTFVVDKNEFRMISSHTGGWTIKKVPERKDTYIQGTYSGLVKFEKKAGTWRTKHLGKTTVPSKYVTFQNNYTAWVAHATRGLYKIKFDENYDTITEVKNYEHKGIGSDYHVRVHDILNTISFKTNEGWYKYEPILDSIVPFNLLNDKFGRSSYIISEEDTEVVALKNNADYVNLMSFSNDDKGLIINDPLLRNKHIVGHENMSKISDSLYALNLDNGFMIVNSKAKTKINLYKPEIERIYSNKIAIKLADIAVEPITFNFNEGIVIELTSPKSVNHYFEYLISGTDTWYKVEGNRVEFSNLNNGSYNISFRARNTSGSVSPVQTLNIEVIPPWYKDTIGFVLYFAIIGAAAALFYLMYHKKIHKEQRLIKIKFQKEQQKLLREKTLENEKRVVQLKNESLENEIKLKSKQLANNAMALVKKNETLQEIKKEMITTKDSFNNAYAYKKLLKKLDNSIVLKDEWEVFEYNFSQVHDDFFKTLKAKHSQLTPKDLKVCAYIKMNLSSKEIAPLMNISVRGVETHRYRLKRKLDLENDISVVDYLLNIK